MKKIWADIKPQGYSITVGYDIYEACLSELHDISNETSIFLLSDGDVFPLYGPQLQALLEQEGYRVISCIVPSGEESKSWVQAGKVLDQMVEARLGRKGLVIALGGGVIGDLGAFVAAIYRRGAPLLQIPTTLLAQVDSSVGGKAAVNHPLGKNMLGTFYQPRAVWINLTVLATLPDREWQAGLAEVLKYALLGDEDLFYFMEEHAQAIYNRDRQVIPTIVSRCCEIKASVVSQDERDEGMRNILNLGHTIGHALEAATTYGQYRHGEAVAVGLHGIFRLAQILGLVEKELADRVEALLQFWKLPTHFSVQRVAQVQEKMIYDKKVMEQKVMFIIPTALGQVTIRRDIPPDVVRKALEMISE